MTSKPKSPKAGTQASFVAGKFQIDLLEGLYFIDVDGVPLATPAGHLISSPNGALIMQIQEELGAFPRWEVDQGRILAPHPISSYTLHSSQVDFCERRHTWNREFIQAHLQRDRLLRRAAGPEWVEQEYAWRPVGLALDLFQEGKETGFWGGQPVDDIRKKAMSIWKSANQPAQSTVINLGHKYSSFLGALALVSRGITPDQFAHAILATTLFHAEIGLVPEGMDPSDTHYQVYSEIRDDARTAIQFLEVADISRAEVRRLIDQGETERIEFKETALGRSDGKPKEKKSAKEKIIRTLAAFLSAAGGWLLVGVDDSGSVVGPQECVGGNMTLDQVQLSLVDLLRSRLGLRNALKIRLTATDKLEGKTILVLACQPAGQHVWVRCKDRLKRFIRQGPRTIEVGSRPLSADDGT